jgi:CheY-like chemotaxis protein
MTGPTFLVIEDNPVTLELVTDLLLAAGARVLTADRAEAGIAAAIDRGPDLVLMDLALPDVDGFEATRRLKRDARTAHIPVVAVSAQVMSGDRERALEAGCSGFIPKPLDTRTFALTVAAILNAARAARAAGGEGTRG